MPIAWRKSKKNVARVSRITTLVEEFKHAKRESGGVDDSDLTDLLTDLLHWSAYNKFDFKKALASARMHFGAESDGTE